MLKKQPATKKKESPKHLLTEDITAVLTTALIKLKEGLGEKKFEKRIKKAVKILTHGVKPVEAKKKVVKKKSVKKANKQIPVNSK